MFKSRTLFFLVMQALLMVVVNSYKIDDSCRKEGVEQDIRDAMTSAFDMVDAAMRRFTVAKSDWDQDTSDLVANLFAREGETAQNVQTDKLNFVFGNIRRYYRTEATDGNQVAASDLIIYCNRDRFTLVNKDEQIWKDQSNGVLFGIDERLCKGRDLPKDKTEKIALAITLNPWRDDTSTESDDGQEVTQIQLCPWFVDWVKNRKIRLFRDGIKTMIGKTIIKVVEKTSFLFAQIDALSLLDKVLLHEMTHGRSAWTFVDADGNIEKEGLIDVPAPRSGAGRFSYQSAAYGWNKAVAMAKQAPPSHSTSNQVPENNADSYALFGSICKLMDDQTNPRKVDAKGRIIPRQR